MSSRSADTSPSMSRVVVDDAVDDAVQHAHRAQPQLARLGLEPVPQPGERARLTAADRDDEPVADEAHQLAGLDVGGLLHVAQRLEHDEDAGLVELDLGPLAALDGVLDGQGVQLQLLVHLVELRLGRVLQPDPQEVARRAAVAQRRRARR